MMLSILFMLLAQASHADSGSKAVAAKTETATLAGGCFWCMFPPFAKQQGIVKVTAGYTGGKKDNPTYDEVSEGTTGHVEAVEIVFDPAKITYDQILDRYWKTMDPTDANGQFADRGTQYRSIIFYHGDDQKKKAEKSKANLEKSKKFDKKIVTQILEAPKFWPAEDYHQDYYKKNPTHFQLYEKGSGREDFLKDHWGKDAE
jgi:peptide methionine sulfoxide reductase msrA/msrB